MHPQFLDLATKAKELGISDALLTSRIHSEQLPCFIYLANERVHGTQEQFLPAFDEDDFSFIDWLDHGSAIEWGHNHYPERTPTYHVTGWAMLEWLATDIVLTRGEIELDNGTVWIFDSQFHPICPLRVSATPLFEWAKGEDGDYSREIPVKIRRTDLFMVAAETKGNKPSRRSEASLLRIVAALRELLLSKDGGNFPSQAKIIDLLVERHSASEGVSKRNLEKVFAEAARVAGSD